MGDMAEDFRLMNQVKRENKNDRLIANTNFLIQHNIPFRTYNEGYHLQIDLSSDSVLNFWPSTGRWRVQNRFNQYQWGYGGYGIESLIKFLKKNQHYTVSTMTYRSSSKKNNLSNIPKKEIKYDTFWQQIKKLIWETI